MILIVGGIAALFILPLVLALWLGKPVAPPPLDSVSLPFRSVDLSALPPLATYPARDGTRLAYRRYAARAKAPLGTVVLVHGSSAHGASMHPLAMGLSGAGWDVIALDMRGHGASGDKGRIAYIGQLEDDLQDLLTRVPVQAPKILLGFSSGGGFTLRFAGGDRQDLFDAYLLLAPYLSWKAPTCRENGGGWAGVGVPRIVALTFLNKWGIHGLNGLPVLAFALPREDAERLTLWYSYALWSNFQPHEDYQADIRRARRPMAVLEGTEDELFRPDRFAGEFAVAPGKVPVILVPGLKHVGLILDPRGIRAAVDALDGLIKARLGS